MVAPKTLQHLLIAVGAEDSVEDNVVAVVQRIPCHLVDQPDIRAARPVLLLEDRPADQVLRDPGDAVSMGRAQGLRDGTLPRA